MLTADEETCFHDFLQRVLSELLEYLKDMFSRYYIESEYINIFSYMLPLCRSKDMRPLSPRPLRVLRLEASAALIDSVWIAKSVSMTTVRRYSEVCGVDSLCVCP